MLPPIASVLAEDLLELLKSMPEGATPEPADFDPVGWRFRGEAIR